MIDPALALFLIGAPGAGKTTMSSLLAAELDGLSVRSGELLRRVGSTTSDESLRAAIAYAMETSLPVAPEIYLRAIRDSIGDSGATSLVFDGYPKSATQCEMIPQVLEAANLPGARIIGYILEITSEAAVARLGTRNLCMACGSDQPSTGSCCPAPSYIPRPDDESEHFRSRTALFEQLQQTVSPVFSQNWPLHRIEASSAPESVAAEILRRVTAS